MSHLSGVMGFAREQAGLEPRGVRARLRARVGDPERVRAARQRLIEAGYSPDLVKSYPPTQAILLDEKRDYEIQRDERMKASVGDTLADRSFGRRQRYGVRNGAGCSPISCPTLLKLRRTQARLEQQIAILRQVEALRLHAAVHDGQAAHQTVRYFRAAAYRSGYRKAVRLFLQRSNRPYSWQLGSGR